MSSIQKLLVLVFCLSSFCTAFANVEGVIGDTPLEQNPNLAFALPQTGNSEIVISRQQYVISYNKNRRAPNWVAWKLEKKQLGTSGRSNKFEQDPDLESYLTRTSGGHAVRSTDYKSSCFDRGHQVPSGDRTDNAANNAVTFMMSNMIPQTPYLNRVIWEHLENYTREIVKDGSKKVYVVAGPIYDVDFGTIGPDQDIPVPSKDFKIIFVLNSDQGPQDIDQKTQVISVVMPNVLKGGEMPIAGTPNCGDDGGVSAKFEAENNDDWKQYQTTVADIESKSSLSFQDLTAKLAHPHSP
jgi:DNA/RNA endonuclease G (NUC1)